MVNFNKKFLAVLVFTSLVFTNLQAHGQSTAPSCRSKGHCSLSKVLKGVGIALIGLVVSTQASVYPPKQDICRSESHFPLSYIHPGQEFVGKSSILSILEKSESSTNTNTRPPKSLQGAIGPDGRFYLADGHHYATAKYYKDMADTATIQVLGDFSERSWREFHEFTEENKLILHSTESLKTFEKEVSEGNISAYKNLFDQLPDSIGDLKDSPLRSTMGEILSKELQYDKKSVQLENFFEFFPIFASEKVLKDYGLRLGQFQTCDQSARDGKECHKFSKEDQKKVALLLRHSDVQDEIMKHVDGKGKDGYEKELKNKFNTISDKDEFLKEWSSIN